MSRNADGMPLVDRVLAVMRVRTRSAQIGTCPVCGGRVTDGEARLRLRTGGHVHAGCAGYRVRRAQREDRVAAVRSGLHPPAGTD